ncbi:transposase [Parasphingopyxis marina]|uniref:Transposase n=1 Tax=Parasphingopyxis marina TaxID=2761622 RepID=A0A842HW37_9SPHN|nr:transposase [Parasphingopyxis marina]MBC2777115.1 transposase [Parasphingopyxis marina]
MPRELPCADREAIAFDDFIAALDASGFDARDEESFASLAPLLRKLSNNTDFLGNFIVRELETRCQEQSAKNRYGIQVLMLHSGPGYFIRANFWPSRTDSLMKFSGDAPFFYGIPHDHNFHFLTIGYSGPGYWSDYYEYDYESVAGYPGEAVDLRFVERSRLAKGRMLLYRAHRDVHRQLPADELSVSLNIMESSPASAWRDQYRFDVDKGEIAALLTQIPGGVLMQLAMALGGEEGVGLVADFAAHHPSDRLRYQALAARAAVVPADEALCIWELGCADPSAQLRGLGRAALTRIEAVLAKTDISADGPLENGADVTGDKGLAQ